MVKFTDAPTAVYYIHVAHTYTCPLTQPAHRHTFTLPFVMSPHDTLSSDIHTPHLQACPLTHPAHSHLHSLSHSSPPQPLIYLTSSLMTPLHPSHRLALPLPKLLFCTPTSPLSRSFSLPQTHLPSRGHRGR